MDLPQTQLRSGVCSNRATALRQRRSATSATEKGFQLRGAAGQTSASYGSPGRLTPGPNLAQTSLQPPHVRIGDRRERCPQTAVTQSDSRPPSSAVAMPGVACRAGGQPVSEPARRRPQRSLPQPTPPDANNRHTAGSAGGWSVAGPRSLVVPSVRPCAGQNDAPKSASASGRVQHGTPNCRQIPGMLRSQRLVGIPENDRPS